MIAFSKRQNTCESSTYGSELVAMRIARDMVSALRIKLKCFGIPIAGPTNVFCDNNAVVQNVSIPESTLAKKHNAINYHIIREAVAAGIIRVGKEDTLTNIADVFTKLVPFTRKYQLLSPFLWDRWGRFARASRAYRGDRSNPHSTSATWNHSWSGCTRGTKNGDYLATSLLKYVMAYKHSNQRCVTDTAIWQTPRRLASDIL